MDNILEIVKKDMLKKEHEYIGRFYYNYKPCNNCNESEYFIQNGIEYKVDSSSNSEIYVNYTKMLITQKIDYLLGKKPNYDNSINDLGLNVYTMLDKLVLNASLDKRAWLHLYVSNDKLTYIVIKDNEIIPMYSSDNKKLDTLIRYYYLDKILHIEIWTTTGVKYLSYDKNNNLLNSKSSSHYVTEYYTGDILENTIESNFKSIPFIKLDNNKDVTSDIDDIVSLIQTYNQVATGFVDNIKKFQEALLIIQNGMTDIKELKQLMKDVKEAKAISAPKDGGVGYLTVEIPVEAREVLMKLLREAIFVIGRGVDPNKMYEGSHLTNIVLKSRYIHLDNKSNDCSKRIFDFYDEFINFINSYTNNNNFSNELVFNKSMLINESELIDNCTKSVNIVSRRTLLTMHPNVLDVDAEEEQLNKENKTTTSSIDNPSLNKENTRVI